ncbi:MAG: type III-A CRISPR-associated protein Cas10/Csm1 [Firmicutes bacterium]|nr:type III-A CRISPR-associated protein Cas10/Csm1 [Bacillota bacterium]
MTNEHTNLIIGSLLHDIGKIIFRAGERKNHSESGYEYLKNELGFGESADTKTVLDCVLYHHSALIKNAKIADDSMAYITYIADNIASASDRREASEPEPGFDARLPLESIFNHFKKNNHKHYYAPAMLGRDESINYPSDEKKPFTQEQYDKIKLQMTDALKRGITWDFHYINSLLEILESAAAYIPSSTSKKEVADISLYDHSKLTAAISSCIYMYLQSTGEHNYKECLFKNAEEFYKRDAFLLFSADISGIQNFIYTVQGEGALKMLRAKSFYLEIFMENMIDELFEKIGVSRANLLYCGGGHMYALLPNTAETIEKINNMHRSVNKWLRGRFNISLYVSFGYEPCSKLTLHNEPSGSYKALYSAVSKKISEDKSHRYSAEDIIELNSQKVISGERECRICKAIGPVDEDGLCTICASIKNFDILNKDFFTIVSEELAGSIPVMEGRWLVADSEKELRTRIGNQDSSFIRAFSKNAFYSGQDIASKLWVGDYTISGASMNDFAKAAEGIDRVAVLRLDVDNLGQAFVAGFDDEANDNRYVTLSRTATFSRQMSIFFKYHINHILKNPQHDNFANKNKSGEGRNVSIVYSGGDDVFLVGAWNDVIDAALDINDSFEKFSRGSLTISGGIGLYSAGYPIHVMADEVGKLEDFSKELEGKNAVTLFYDSYKNKNDTGKNEKNQNDSKKTDTSGRYDWKTFADKVIGEKYNELRVFFESNQDRGKSFLYRLLELLRGRSEKINFARYVYLLARMEPAKEASPQEKEDYRAFTEKMYNWMKDEEDCRQLITAIYLYAYHTRQEEKDNAGRI